MYHTKWQNLNQICDDTTSELWITNKAPKTYETSMATYIQLRCM